ncbi:unnamed protein product [Cochlearia groenlandica]
MVANGRRSVLLGLVKTQWERVPSESLSPLSYHSLAFSSSRGEYVEVAFCVGSFKLLFLDHRAELQAEIQNLHATQANNMQFYNSLFTVLSASNPELLRTMQTHPLRPTTEQAGTSNVDPENATQDYFGPNFNLDD